MAADSRFARRLFTVAGIGAGDLVVLTAGASEYAQVWPYEAALESLGACIAIAENLRFDAGRTEMFLRRFSMRAAFGIGPAVLDGLHDMGKPLDKVFGNTPVIFARDLAVNRLRAVGLKPWRVETLGPAFAFEDPDGETYYDRDEWLIESDNGELVITALNDRANPLVRLRTGVGGAIDSSTRTVTFER